MNLSKLQSEAVKEFEKKFPCSLHVEKFLLDQIQKAVEKTRKEDIGVINDYISNINSDPFWNTDKRVDLLDKIILSIQSKEK